MKKLLLHDEDSLVFQPHPSLLLVWAVTNKKQTKKKLLQLQLKNSIFLNLRTLFFIKEKIKHS